jgi:MFS family permease
LASLSSEEALAPQRSHRRFFYGWYIVFIVFMTSLITAGIGGWGLSFFLIPMSEDFGVSRTEFSAITLFRLVPLPFLPFLGSFVDKKHGARILIVAGSIAAGIILIATSQVQNIWQFYIVYGIFFSFAQFTIGGQLVGPAVLAKWFIKKRGRVMAISAIGISGGGFVISPAAGWFIENYDWRVAWIFLGILMIVSITPAGAIFMRRQPEDLGMLPDGISPEEAASARSAQGGGDLEYPWTRREAIRTRAMWLLLGVQTFGGIALMPTLFHQVSYIQDKGFALSDATTIAFTTAAFAILGKLFYGFLAEKIHIRWALVLCLIPSGMSLALLVMAGNMELLYVYAISHGLTMGGWAPLMNMVWAVYYGRQHLGAIRGLVTPVGNIFGAITPMWCAWMYDRMGSYDLPFSALATSWVLGGVIMLFVMPPKPPVLDKGVAA